MITRLLIALLLAQQVFCYLELELLRAPHDSKNIPYPAKLNCSTFQPKDQDYPEICYRRDINYGVELYHHDEIYVLAMDFTAPISWIKNINDCRLNENPSKPCSLLERPIRQKVKEKVRNVKRNIKDKVSKVLGKKTSEEKATEEAKTSVGALEKVSGLLEKSTNVEFWTKDSSKFINPYKLLMIGLFMTDESEKVALSETNFINATRIPQHVDSLMDGAISLRFDDESENSFLNEIFTFVGTKEKIVTIYLGANSTITIGDLSVKNAEKGYSGIEWLALDQKRFLMMDVLTIETTGSEKIDQINTEADAFFTLSASYIGLPTKIITELTKILDPVAKCAVAGPDQYIQCMVKNSKQFEKKKLVFEIGETKITLDISELIKSKSKNNTWTLNIRNSENEYVILGEPLFKKYFVVLDYAKNKMGIADRRVTFEDKIFSLISLIRFLTVTFILGVCFIIFFKPCLNFYETLKIYYGRKDPVPYVPQERAGLRYSNIQENPYQDLADKMQNALSEPVEGI